MKLNLFKETYSNEKGDYSISLEKYRGET